LRKIKKPLLYGLQKNTGFVKKLTIETGLVTKPCVTTRKIVRVTHQPPRVPAYAVFSQLHPFVLQRSMSIRCSGAPLLQEC
jgi:hypothetical protein